MLRITTRSRKQCCTFLMRMRDMDTCLVKKKTATGQRSTCYLQDKFHEDSCANTYTCLMHAYALKPQWRGGLSLGWRRLGDGSHRTGLHMYRRLSVWLGHHCSQCHLRVQGQHRKRVNCCA